MGVPTEIRNRAAARARSRNCCREFRAGIPATGPGRMIMLRPLTMLGIHGLGDHRRSTWADEWRRAIAGGLADDVRDRWEFVPFDYDALFERVQISPTEAWRALRKLVRPQRAARQQTERLQESTRWLRWYAGYVVAWLEDEPFRREVREQLLAALRRHRPHVIVAHSLGSLISYDVLSGDLTGEDAQRCRDFTYVTLGSQLGHPLVTPNLTSAELRPLPVRRWWHLFNPHDDVFTAPVRFPDQAGCEQIVTPFDADGWADHDAVRYLQHPEAARRLWSGLRCDSTP